MKTLRVTICVMLIVGVLAMSLSVFADNEPVPTLNPDDGYVPAEVLWGESGNYLVWLMLQSWGIEISVDSVTGYTDAIRATLTDLVVEYLDSLPSPMSIWSWIMPWTWGSDFWGNYRFNASMLEDVEDFAEWLKVKFNLQDSQIYPLNPVITVNGYPLYSINKFYDASYDDGTGGANGYFAISEETPSNEVIGYFVAYNTDIVQPGNYPNCECVFVSTSVVNSSIYYTKAVQSEGVNTLIQGGLAVNQSNSNGYKFSRYSFPFDWTNGHGFFRPVGTAFVGTGSQIDNFCRNFTIAQESNMNIVTEIIALPDSSPSYEPGYSMTIVDGEPDYSLIEWDGEVTVNNLPAIITQNRIPDIGNDTENPGFSVPWQAINGLIQYVAAPAGAIMAIVNEAPVEGVIMLYALIGGIIIFGMIRVMREH